MCMKRLIASWSCRNFLHASVKKPSPIEPLSIGVGPPAGVAIDTSSPASTKM